jgi:hypothetical protein
VLLQGFSELPTRFLGIGQPHCFFGIDARFQLFDALIQLTSPERRRTAFFLERSNRDMPILPGTFNIVVQLSEPTVKARAKFMQLIFTPLFRTLACTLTALSFGKKRFTIGR